MKNSGQLKRIINAIKNDRQSGANEITESALTQVAEFAFSLQSMPDYDARATLIKLIKGLQLAQVNMAPLQNLLMAMLAKLAELDCDSHTLLTAQFVAYCQQLKAQLHERITKQQAVALRVLSHSSVLFTFSRSSAVCAVFKALVQRPVRFIVCESRPGYEGRTLACELGGEGFHVDFIIDAASGLFIQNADAVLVGADAILNDGSVVNKVGTQIVALLAQHYHVPFYVLADSSKCMVCAKQQFKIQGKPLSELEVPESPYIHGHNIYFDITEPALVSGYITEYGLKKHWPWQGC